MEMDESAPVFISYKKRSKHLLPAIFVSATVTICAIFCSLCTKSKHFCSHVHYIMIYFNYTLCLYTIIQYTLLYSTTHVITIIVIFRTHALVFIDNGIHFKSLKLIRLFIKYTAFLASLVWQ